MSDYTKNPAFILNTEQAIEFNDKNLESAIKNALKLGGEENITSINILKLTHFRALKKNISDLSDLEYAENLQLLTLTGNKITSLDPLKNLNQLYSVGFAYNPDLKMEEILKLEHLTELDLSGNQYSVKEFTQLKKYSDMVILWLNSCQLDSISFV